MTEREIAQALTKLMVDTRMEVVDWSAPDQRDETWAEFLARKMASDVMPSGLVVRTDELTTDDLVAFGQVAVNGFLGFEEARAAFGMLAVRQWDSRHRTGEPTP